MLRYSLDSTFFIIICRCGDSYDEMELETDIYHAKTLQGEAMLEKKLLENYIGKFKRKNREDSPIPGKKQKLEKTSNITVPKSI